MRKALSFLLLFTLLSSVNKAVSQKLQGKIKGTVYSDSSYKTISDASVSLINAKDSSVEKLTVTNNKGYFNFIDVKLGDYAILITVINHIPLSKTVRLTELKKEISLDSLVMTFTSDSLATVTVTGYRTPIVLKTDTTEFNASSFKVKENALVEDLLKKLPGLEVLKDGSVKAQGEKITQIYVDGKPFFGGDPKMATQNLPANIIDKIQVIDQKSEQAQVTKVEDGVREKIINITIKKNRNKGYFGRAYLGYGTSERYEGKVTANYFNKSSKVSLVAGGNNTGRNDFSSGEDESTSYNNYNGVTKDVQAKLSYTDKWSKKFDINANLGYSNNVNMTEQIRNRQNIFDDSTNYYYEQNLSSRKRSGLNGGFGFEYKPDTFTTVRLNQNATFGNNTYNNISKFNSSLIDSKRINEGTRSNTSSNFSPSINGNVSINCRFHKPRRAFFFNANNYINNNLSDGFNISNNYFFPVNAGYYELLLNQFLNNDNRSSSINSSASYSEPITKKSTINLSLSYNYSTSLAIRETFDFNNNSGYYDILNDTLTNNFKNSNHNTSLGINYSYSLKKGNISVGSTFQDARTISKALSKDTIYRQHFSGIVPYLSMNLNNKGKRFGMNYNFNNRAPQAYQLQPVIDNSNPLYTRLGNPNLKYATNHRINANFNYYNAKKQTNIYSNLSFSLTANNFSTSTIFDKVTGRQTSQPINVNGVYNANGNIGFNKPFTIFKQKFSWSTNTNYNFGRNVSLINNEQNINRQYSGRIGSGLTYEIDDKLDLEFRPSINVQTTQFSLKPNLNNTNYTYGCEYAAEFEFGKLSELTINGDFSKNTGRSAGFNRNINMINVDFLQYLNNKKIWWVKLKVYDLLKQNLSIYRYSGESFIEDIQTNVLTRFFLISLNYKLNKFTGKG